MAAQWRSDGLSDLKVAIERRIEEIGGRQLQLVTTEQLICTGLTSDSIRGRLRCGRLRRMHRGVHSLHPPPYSREQRWLAAVLSCGLGTTLSDWPAAAHLGISDHSARHIHVTVAGSRGRTRSGIVVHRRGPIDPRDYRVHQKIPVTSAALTMIHLSPHLEPIELERMGVAAESKGLLNRSRLRELVTERRGRPGVHKLEPFLEVAPRRAASDPELLFIPIVEAAGLPRPLLNHPIAVPERDMPLKVDCYWPDIEFVVELDSQRFHGDWERAEIDRDRDQQLALVGRSCQRFVRRVVKEDPVGTAARLRALYEARAREMRDSRT